MKKNEIWLVDFEPSKGKEYRKIRPAVIIQSDGLKTSLLTVMPISSKLENQSPDDIFIKKNTKNRLFSDSIIKTYQISSFDKKRFVHFIGNIDEKTISKINVYLKKHFKL